MLLFPRESADQALTNRKTVSTLTVYAQHLPRPIPAWGSDKKAIGNAVVVEQSAEFP
jgi:hypothetical protein